MNDEDKKKLLLIILTGGLAAIFFATKGKGGFSFLNTHIKTMLRKLDNIYSIFPPKIGRIRSYSDLETNNYKKLSVVYPTLAGKVNKVIKKMNSWLKKQNSTYRVGVFEGLRSNYEQFRRYKAKKSKALPGQSYHQLGLAVDIVFWSPSTGWTWSVPETYWQELGKIGKAYGLHWGGDWGWDKPHFQMNISDLPSTLQSSYYTKKEMMQKAFVSAARADGYSCVKTGNTWKCNV